MPPDRLGIEAQPAHADADGAGAVLIGFSHCFSHLLIPEFKSGCSVCGRAAAEDMAEALAGLAEKLKKLH